MDWIKLKDRKPDNGVGVIVYLRVSGFITVAYRTLIEHDNCYSWQLFGDTNMIIPNNDEVTHWMPTPKPPEN